MTGAILAGISPNHPHQCHVTSIILMRQAATAVQLPEEQLEVYGKGQHLRGADAAFADQVLDELVCHRNLVCCRLCLSRYRI